MTRRYAEDKIQADIVEWLRLVAPNCIVAAIPNGAFHDARQGARLKWTGMLPGIPDLILLAPGSEVMFVEVKAPAGVLSPEQRAVHAALADLGHTVIVARDVSDVRAALQSKGVRTREAA